MRASRLSCLLGVALAASAFAYLMAYPPALDGADESFALYEAKRLWEGDAPYRDFFDFIAPGTFYFYAAAYAVAGPTMAAARTATALLNAGSCGLTYLLARRVASPALAGLAAAAFVTGMVPAWNHAGHHWLATFLSLATAAVTLSRRWRDSERARPACAGGLAAALVCTNQARGAWIAVWLAATLPLLAWTRREPDGWRRALRETWWAGLGALAVATPMLGWPVWRASLREVFDATFAFVSRSYGRRHVGMLSWGESLDARGGLADPTIWPWFLRAIPALLGVEGLSLAGAMLTDGPRPHLVRGSLLLLAVCAACSVFYFPDHIHVATIAPFPLVVIAGLAQRAGAAIAARGSSPLTTAWRLACVLAAGVIGATGAGRLRAAWAANPVLVSSAFGTFATSAGGAEALRELQDLAPAPGRARPTLLAYPADAWLYLALPADNPTPFCLMARGYSTPEQFERAIARLRADPDALVLIRWPLVPPDDPILALLLREYTTVKEVGLPHPVTGLRGLHLFARRDRPGVPQVAE